MRGLGALGVIVGHAVQEVYARQELWLVQHPGSGVGSHLGTLDHHLLFALRQLALFAVPMFVFVSGFVRAADFAARELTRLIVLSGRTRRTRRVNAAATVYFTSISPRPACSR